LSSSFEQWEEKKNDKGGSPAIVFIEASPYGITTAGSNPSFSATLKTNKYINPSIQ